MASCLFGAKPLSEPMRTHLDLQEHMSEVLIKAQFLVKEMSLEMLSHSLQNYGHFVSASNVLSN